MSEKKGFLLQVIHDPLYDIISSYQLLRNSTTKEREGEGDLVRGYVPSVCILKINEILIRKDLCYVNFLYFLLHFILYIVCL